MANNCSGDELDKIAGQHGIIRSIESDDSLRARLQAATEINIFEIDKDIGEQYIELIKGVDKFLKVLWLDDSKGVLRDIGKDLSLLKMKYRITNRDGKIFIQKLQEIK